MFGDENTDPGSTSWCGAGGWQKVGTPLACQVANTSQEAALCVADAAKGGLTAPSAPQARLSTAPPARQPFTAISSNLPASKNSKQQFLHKTKATASSDLPVVNYGPLCSAALGRKALQEQQLHVDTAASTDAADQPHEAQALRRPDDAAHGQPSAQLLMPYEAFARSTSSHVPDVSIRGSGMTGSNMMHAAVAAQHGLSTSILQDTSCRQIPADMRAAPTGSLPAHSVLTSAGQRSTPSSSEALHRLRHQQQLRWQQHINRMAGPGSAGMGQAVPFTQHPAVSLLLSQHPSDLLAQPAFLPSSPSTHSSQSQGLKGDRSSSPAANAHMGTHHSACSSASGCFTSTQVAPSAGHPAAELLLQGRTVPQQQAPHMAQGTAISNATRPSTSQVAGTHATSMHQSAAAQHKAAQDAVLQADMSAMLQQLLFSKVQGAATTARSLEQTLLTTCQLGVPGVPMANVLAQGLAATTATAAHSAASASMAEGHGWAAARAAAAARQLQLTAAARALAAREHQSQPSVEAELLWQHASWASVPADDPPQICHTSSLTCQHSTTSTAAAGPVGYADSMAGLASFAHTSNGADCCNMQRFVPQQPQSQAQQADLMFVRRHRSQQRPQSENSSQRNSQQQSRPFSMKDRGYNESLLQLAASRGDCAEGTTTAADLHALRPAFFIAAPDHQHAAHAGTSSTRTQAAHNAAAACSKGVSISRGTGISQQGVLVAAAALAADQQPAPASGLAAVDIDGLPVPGPLTASLRATQTGGLRTHNRPVCVLGPSSSSAAPSGGSILDSIQLPREGHSSAAAIKGIATTGAQPQLGAEPARGKALELLAGKAATAMARQRQQAQKSVSRLHAASYPAAPNKQDAVTAIGASAFEATAGTGRPASAYRNTRYSAAAADASAHSSDHSMQPSLKPRPPISMSDITDTLQLQDSAVVSASTSSSIGSSGSRAAEVAGPLCGSRLSLWQRQPSAESAAGRRQLSMSIELRASFSGALRCVTDAVRGSTAKPAAKTASGRQSIFPMCSGSPTAYLSPIEPGSGRSHTGADTFLTPEDADTSSESCCSGSSLSDSLADTAASAVSYMLRPHMLSRNTPFVGLMHDLDDYCE